MDEILAKTSGEIYKLEPELESILFLLLVQGSSMPARVVFGRTGSFYPTGGSFATRHTLAPIETTQDEMKKKYVEKGLVLNDMGEGGWGSIIDHAHVAYIENETEYDPRDLESSKAMVDALRDTVPPLIDKRLYVPVHNMRYISYPKSMHEGSGPLLSNYHIWQRKIKEAFNPNNASDPTAYL